MLELASVSKSFSHQPVVRHVDLKLQDGEFLSILGPSGCGKTTLLRMIAGLEFPDQGVVRLAGEDITRRPAHKRNIHTVFQRYALFPHMNVFDNVAFGLRCKKTEKPEIQRRVDAMLKLANLNGYEKRRIPTLSGGEQQRVALIRALVNLPQLLLLDEPLGALDLKLRLQLQEELVSLQKKVRTTFLFVTHDQQEALNMSDRIAVMNKGCIEQVGTPQEVYEFPQTLFVADFVGQMNRFSGVLKEEAGKWSCHVEGAGRFCLTDERKTSTGSLAAGTRAIYCVRPEKLSVHEKRPSTAENVAEGVIESQAYLGTHSHFVVRLSSGQLCSVFQQSTQRLSRKLFHRGGKVVLSWSSQHAHCFPEANS